MSNEKAEGFLEKRIAELERLLFESEQTGNFYPKDPEWIKCSDRLPEPGAYIVWREPTEKYGSYIQQGLKVWNGESWNSKQNVTHWMPLPAAPKGEE